VIRRLENDVAIQFSRHFFTRDKLYNGNQVRNRLHQLPHRHAADACVFPLTRDHDAPLRTKGYILTRLCSFYRPDLVETRQFPWARSRKAMPFFPILYFAAFSTSSCIYFDKAFEFITLFFNLATWEAWATTTQASAGAAVGRDFPCGHFLGLRANFESLVVDH